MAASAWLHCNFCDTRPKKDLSFHLASCGHIVCQNCVDSKNLAVTFQCTLCNKGKPSTRIQIEKNIRPSAKEYFMFTPDWMEQRFKEAMASEKFQTACRQRLLRRRKQQDKAMSKWSEMWQAEMQKKAEMKKAFTSLHTAYTKLAQEMKVVRNQLNRQRIVQPMVALDYRAPTVVDNSNMVTPVRSHKSQTTMSSNDSTSTMESNYFNSTQTNNQAMPPPAENAKQFVTPKRKSPSSNPYEYLMRGNSKTMPPPKMKKSQNGVTM